MTSRALEARDPRFSRVVHEGSVLRRLASGLTFTEGPVWMGEELIFSDIPANKLMSWHAERGLTVFREPGQWPNGNTLDQSGRLITCEHGWRNVSRTQLTRRITRMEVGGQLSVLLDSVHGQPLMSPNDVVVDTRGQVWFTDPPWGAPDFVGPVRHGQDYHAIYRLDPESGDVNVIWNRMESPNGLCFSPDETFLYVGNSIPEDPTVYRFALRDGQAVSPPAAFAYVEVGVPDGMCTDPAGRLYCSGGDAVYVFHPDGTLLGKLFVPEMATNCCFGGAEGHTLFVTASSGVYAMTLHPEGVA